MWQDILAIMGFLGGMGAVVGVGIWIGGVNTFLKELRQDREKYPPAESYLMLSTLWETYIIDPLHKRPDLGSFHSPCALTPKGLELLSEDTKKELKEILATLLKREDLATGYIIVEHFGLERLSNMAAASGVSLQEEIAVLSTYLATCRENS